MRILATSFCCHQQAFGHIYLRRVRDVLPLLLAFALALLACEPSGENPPAAIADGPVNWSYVVVADDGNRWRARGFNHAVPALSRLRLYFQEQQIAQAQADENGRFDLHFDLASTQSDEVKVKIQVLNAQGAVAELDFTPRRLAQALPKSVRGRLLQTGALPNDLRFVPALCDTEHAPLLMLSSGDNLLDNFDVQSHARSFSATSFSQQQGLAAQPFNFAVHGQVAAVSLFGQDALSLVDLRLAQEIDRAVQPEKLPLPEIFVPALPVDSDGDGQVETEISQLRPRQFEAVAFDGQRLYVSAINMLRSEHPAVYAPGMVLVFDWNGESLQAAQPQVLWPGFANPQTILLDADHIYVVSTGIIEQTDAGWQASSSAGLSIFSRADLQPVAQVDLGACAAGPALLSDDGESIYIGSLLHADLYKVDLAQMLLVRGLQNPIRLAEASGPQSIFALQWHPSGLIFVSSFNQDALIVVDSQDDRVLPWPFIEPLDLNPDNALLAGSQQIALRPGRNGVDFRGADFFILQSLAARVVSVDSRYIFGP